MKEPTEVREFWENFGFTSSPFAPQFHTNTEGDLDPVYVYDPNGKGCDYPPIDLNSLFEYAVPKLDEFLDLELEIEPLLVAWAKRVVWEDDIDAADALFRALKKAFDERDSPDRIGVPDNIC